MPRHCSGMALQWCACLGTAAAVHALALQWCVRMRMPWERRNVPSVRPTVEHARVLMQWHVLMRVSLCVCPRARVLERVLMMFMCVLMCVSSHTRLSSCVRPKGAAVVCVVGPLHAYTCADLGVALGVCGHMRGGARSQASKRARTRHVLLYVRALIRVCV